MPNPYNDVELTEGDKQSIFEPAEAESNSVEADSTTESSQTHEADTLEGETEVSESDEFNLEDYEVEIDGEVYDGADIMRWQEDSANKENWQASNTQKAQEIAKWSKFNDKLSSDDEFRDYVKDFFYDDNASLEKLGLDKDLQPLEYESEDQPYEESYDRIDEVEGRLNEMEFERHVDDLEVELDSIIEDNPDLFSDVDDDVKFLEFAQESGMSDLTQAFKVWGYDKMQGEVDHHRKLDGNKQRNQGKVVHNSKIGATEESSPKQYKEMKDININDPDVAKYFNR